MWPAAILGAGLMGTMGFIQSQNELNATEKLNAENLKYQRERDYNQIALFREEQARADNAMQRRVNDLEAAGLSPMLATTGAAGAGSTSQPTLMGQKKEYKEYVNPVQGIVQSMGLAQTLMGLINSQQQQSNQNKIAAAQASKIITETDIMKHKNYMPDDKGKILYHNTGLKYFASNEDAKKGRYTNLLVPMRDWLREKKTLDTLNTYGARKQALKNLVQKYKHASNEEHRRKEMHHYNKSLSLARGSNLDANTELTKKHSAWYAANFVKDAIGKALQLTVGGLAAKKFLGGKTMKKIGF